MTHQVASCSTAQCRPCLCAEHTPGTPGSPCDCSNNAGRAAQPASGTSAAASGSQQSRVLQASDTGELPGAGPGTSTQPGKTDPGPHHQDPGHPGKSVLRDTHDGEAVFSLWRKRSFQCPFLSFPVFKLSVIKTCNLHNPKQMARTQPQVVCQWPQPSWSPAA